MRLGRADQRVSAGERFEAQGAPARAEREYRAALEIAPRHTLALNNLGLLLAARGRFADAAPLFRRASLADPSAAVFQANLAGALREMGDEAGAQAAYQRMLSLDPASPMAPLNLANLLRSRGALDEARPYYQALLRQNPADRTALWNLAALEGLAGSLTAAFAGFARFHALSPAAPRFPFPKWNGEALEGRRLLLDADQGLGDTLMFARYASVLRDRGARVILRAQAELAGLLRGVEGLEAVVARGEPIPAADAWFPLVDLPVFLGAPMSAPRPYLAPAAERVAVWERRLAPGSAARVGFVWAGNPGHPDDRNRSLPLEILLRPLPALEGVEFVSLQKGPRASEADGTPLARADRQIDDFEDTAAVIAGLDLVISADTSVLHLAGAMGRPVWGLIPFAPDWRWMLARADSPWYPTLTLFRQPTPRAWPAVAEAVAAALREFLAFNPLKPPS